MFEYTSMSSSETVRTLRQRITAMQPVRLTNQGLPTARELSTLLPDGALRKGGTYSVHGSTVLGLAFLTEASLNGAWCGIIGLPSLGAEAAAHLGVALDRCIWVPNPGPHALSVAHILSEVLTVILLAPTAPPQHGEAERLSARLRDHGAALVVLGHWPRTVSTLRVSHSEWRGLSEGNGMLRSRELVVQSSDRRGIQDHTLRFTEGRLDPIRTPTMLHAVSS